MSKKKKRALKTECCSVLKEEGERGKKKPSAIFSLFQQTKLLETDSRFSSIMQSEHVLSPLAQRARDSAPHRSIISVGFEARSKMFKMA